MPMAECDSDSDGDGAMFVDLCLTVRWRRKQSSLPSQRSAATEVVDESIQPEDCNPAGSVTSPLTVQFVWMTASRRSAVNGSGMCYHQCDKAFLVKIVG